jgi:hypothetical protein
VPVAAPTADASEQTSGTAASEGTSGTATSGPAQGDGAKGETRSEAEAGAAPEPRRKPSAPATIELRLRPPLRVAYVRIGKGKGFVAAPTAETRVGAGRQSIWWRETPDEPWRDGGSLTFEAGRRYRVRLTSSGAVLE